MTTKIIVDVKGGNVQAIYCNDPNAEVIMYDWDNIEAEADEETLSVLDTEEKRVIQNFAPHQIY